MSTLKQFSIGSYTLSDGVKEIRLVPYLMQLLTWEIDHGKNPQKFKEEFHKLPKLVESSRTYIEDADLGIIVLDFGVSHGICGQPIPSRLTPPEVVQQ